MAKKKTSKKKTAKKAKKKAKKKTARKTKPKPHNEGTLTEAGFFGYIKSGLRSMSLKGWKPIAEARKAARVSRGLYECAHCKEHVPPTRKRSPEKIAAARARAEAKQAKSKSKRKKAIKIKVSESNISVDHINPIIPVTGFVSWDETIKNMFVERDQLQVLCRDCHDIKTAKETAERKKYK